MVMTHCKAMLGFPSYPLPLTLFGVFLGFLSFAPLASADWRQEEQELMGTLVSVEFWSTDEVAARRLFGEVFAEIKRLDEATDSLTIACSVGAPSVSGRKTAFRT